MKPLLYNIIEAFSIDGARRAIIDLLNDESTPPRTIQKIFLTAFDEEENKFIKWCVDERGISDKNAAEIVDRMRRADNLEAIFRRDELAVLDFKDINSTNFNIYATILKAATTADFIDDKLIRAIGTLSGKDKADNGIGAGEYLVALFVKGARMSGSSGGDHGDITINGNIHVEIKANQARLNGQVASLRGEKVNSYVAQIADVYGYAANKSPLSGSTSDVYKWLAKSDIDTVVNWFTEVLPYVYEENTSHLEKEFIEFIKKHKPKTSKDAMMLMVFFCEYAYSTIDKFQYLLILDKKTGHACCIQTVFGGGSLESMWTANEQHISIASGINIKGRQAAPQLSPDPVK